MNMSNSKAKRELIAILRGISPEEAGEAAKILSECGFCKIEVPLNSPNPYASIANMRNAVSEDILIGAGTVLNAEQVQLVHQHGGQFIVSPNFNQQVIEQTRALEMLSYPGIATLSEAFNALDSGANALKLFPANVVGLDGFKAFNAVLPKAIKVYGVGGIKPDDYVQWLKAGMAGFGIGSDLYKQGISMAVLKSNADNIVSAYDQACQLIR